MTCSILSGACMNLVYNKFGNTRREIFIHNLYTGLKHVARVNKTKEKKTRRFESKS